MNVGEILYDNSLIFLMISARSPSVGVRSKESTGRKIGYVEYSVQCYLRRARLRTRVDEVDVRGRRGARSATLPRRRVYARFDVRRRDAQSVSGSLGRQMLLLCSVIKGFRHGYISLRARMLKRDVSLG